MKINVIKLFFGGVALVSAYKAGKYYGKDEYIERLSNNILTWLSPEEVNDFNRLLLKANADMDKVKF